MKILVFLAFSIILYSNYTIALDSQDVSAIQEIWKKLGRKDWRLLDKNNLCGANGIFFCECHFAGNTTCHVTKLYLSNQNLSSLPSEFAKLRYLRHLDLSYNSLAGTIPLEWSTMNLTDLLLMVNQLSGPFPIALTKMTSLQRLDVSSNNFNGQLPYALAKLTRLTMLRICDNNFTGKIPSFISQWTQIETLHILGCSFEGPIPSSISNLTQLRDLKIGDLKGETSVFPSLNGMKEINELLLRNCSIQGEIPQYIWSITTLKTLDLSFNNLTGAIPDNNSLIYLEHIYLTQNNLNGHVPQWVFSGSKDIDLSYNNFTWSASSPETCEKTTVNLVESYFSSNENNNIPPCLRRGFPFPCSKPNKQKIYSLHINCGGKEVYINNTKYEADEQNKGSVPYYKASYWAFSATGKYNSLVTNAYILSNRSSLSNASSVDSGLYTTARASAVSLTYYGLCLFNGNYNVMLHFIEIVFTRYKSFNIMGRRVFDVYVQGELKLKDFDIAKEAGGVGMVVIKSYPVNVMNNTLKIQLYWSGKGTTNLPHVLSYGPVISAISINPNFKPPNYGKRMSVKFKVLIAIAVVVFIVFISLAIGFILRRKGYLNCMKKSNTELRGLELQAGIMSLTKIKNATNNFHPSNKIGEGGFGVVYKGQLEDDTLIAVKQLSSKSKQGDREFITETCLLSALRHPNLVRLYGCSIDGNQLSLILEYMENKCLSQALKDPTTKSKLTWPVRFNICLGIARGLSFLHEGSNTIIHRDIKSSNVLLDENFNAKISDFGLSKLTDEENPQTSVHIVGTPGYIAPEYLFHRQLSTKIDVYSFGIVGIEIVIGQRYHDYVPTREYNSLLYKVRWFRQRGRLTELVDSDIEPVSRIQAVKVLNVALLCSEESATDRPTMSEVVKMLEGETDIPVIQRELNMCRLNPHDEGEKDLWKNVSLSRMNPPNNGGETSVTDSEFTESFVSKSIITEL